MARMLLQRGPMTRIRGSWVRGSLLVVLLGAAACGSVTPLSSDGGAGNGGSSGSAGTHGGAGTQGAAGTQGSAGTQGTAGTQGAAGTQGTSGTQGSAGSNADGGAAGTNAPSCPATFTSLGDGAPCPVASGTSCDYAQGRCGCLPCSSGSGGSVSQGWFCRAWDTGGQGCPPRSPPVGSACSTPNLFCTYGGQCSISVGDNVECTGGTWQRFVSPVGSCALRMCTAGGTDGGTPPPTCSMTCPGGVCWVQLDGSQTCVKPRPAPALDMCQATDTTCCTQDASCTMGTAGRCLPKRSVAENFCGGAIPFGNVCKYDQCRSDTDCKAMAPAGTTVSACVPSGALNTFDATCVHGVCRTDADTGPGGGGGGGGGDG